MGQIDLSVHTVFTEEGLDETLSNVNKLQEATEKYKESMGQNGETAPTIFDYVQNTVTELSSVMTNFSQIIKQTGVDISRSMLAPFNSLNESLLSFTKKFNEFFSKDQKTGNFSRTGNYLNSENAYMQLLEFSEMAGFLKRFNSIIGSGKSFEESFGWNVQDFNKIMPLLTNRLLQDQIKNIKENVFKDSGKKDIEDYVSALMRVNSVRNSLMELSPVNAEGKHHMTQEQMRNNLRASLLMNSSMTRSRIGYDALMGSPFEKKESSIHAHSIIPEQFREAYYGRGEINADDYNSFLQKLSTYRTQKQNIKNSVYDRLIDFVNNDENGSVLSEALKEAKIIDINHGERRWASSLTVEQASKLAGILSRNLYDAKRGYTFYDADPNDPMQEHTINQRMNRRVLANSEALSILAGDSRVTPAVNLELDQNSIIDAKTNYAAGGKRKPTLITNLPTATQIVIPKTQLDEHGELIYRDPSWKKTTGFDVTSDSDYFSIATDSPILEMLTHLGWKSPKTGRVFLGNTGDNQGTFGYGRHVSGEHKGQAIYDVAPIISIPFSQLFTEDENDKTILDPKKVPVFKDMLKNGRIYNGQKYEYLNQGTDSFTFIESTAKKAIEDWQTENGLPNFFELMNPKGIQELLGGKASDLIKQINAWKKSSSTATPYSKLFGELDPYKTRIANLTAFFSALGEINPELKSKYDDTIGGIPDGMALGNTKFFKNGPMQMRSMLGFGKFVLNPYNFDRLFSLVFSGGKVDKNDVTADSWNNNWLVSKNANGELEYWLPSITAETEDTIKLMTGNGIAYGNMSEEQKNELRQLREKSFFRANAPDVGLIQTDKTIKYKDALKHLTTSQYGKFISKQKGISEAKALELAKERTENGLVQLNPEEQGLLHDAFSPELYTMRNAEDFANDKDIVSQQMAAAFGYDVRSLEASDREFDKRVYELTTARGRIKALQANPRYRQKLEEDKSFAYTNEAEKFIQSRIRTLRNDQAMGRIALPEGTVRQDLLAAAHPGVFLQPFLEALGVDVSKISDPMLRQLLPFTLDAEGKMVTSPDVLGNEVAISSRNPAAAGEYVFVSNAFGDFAGKTREQRARMATNADETIARLNKQISRSKPGASIDTLQAKLDRTKLLKSRLEAFNNFQDLVGADDAAMQKAAWMTTFQMYQQNTGDFDGDVISLITGLSPTLLKRAEEIKRNVQAAGIKIENDKFLDSFSGKEIKVDDLEDAELKAALLSYRSTQAMGAASKLIRNAMDLPDDDPNKWRLVYEGKKAYDFASADMRKRAQEFNFSPEALKIISGANLYQRFVKSMVGYSSLDWERMTPEERMAETNNAIDSLFKVGLPTLNDPQGFLARHLVHDSFANKELDYSSFNNSVQTLLKNKYGESQSSEANAARWYANLFSKTMTGRLVSDRDISKGNSLLMDWAMSINDRGINVSDEEKDQFSRFQKRVEGLRDTAPTREKIQAKRDLLLRTQARLGGPGYDTNLDTELDLYNEALVEDKKSSEILDKIGLAQWKDEQVRQERIEKEREEIQKAIAYQNEIYGTEKPFSKIKSLNWSAVKNWIKPKIAGGDIIDVSTISSAGVMNGTATVNFDRAIDRERTALSEIEGKQEQSAAMSIGSLMHKALELYFKAAGEGKLKPGETVDDYYSQLLSGPDKAAVSELASFGYIIKQVNEAGAPLAYSIKGPGYHNDENLAKLNRILPTVRGRSNLAEMIEAVGAEGFDIAHPVNVEGDTFYYTGSGKNKKFKNVKLNSERQFDIETAAYDEKGNVIQDQTDTSRKTYARPDLMLYHEGGQGKSGKNYSQGYYIFDYKSSLGGANESIYQSAYYAAIYDKVAKEYWQEKQKQDAGQEVDLAKLTIGENFKHLGYLNSQGEYISRIMGAAGLNPNDSNTVFFDKNASVRNLEQWNSIYSRFQEAASQKTLDSLLINADENNPYAKALATAARAAQAESTAEKQFSSAAEAIQNGEKVSDPNIQYFLSRYTKDLETISNIRSSLDRESDQPKRIFNRFEWDRNKLVEALPSEVTKAVIQKYGQNSDAAEQIKKEMTEKQRLLSELDMKEEEAVIKDFTKLEENARASFSDTKIDKSTDIFSNVNNQLLRARKTREGLLKRSITIKNNENNDVTVATARQNDENGIPWQLLSPEQQANLFLTDSDNDKVKKEAIRLQDKFKDSINAEKKATETVKKFLTTSIKADEANDAQDWASITGEIIDPSVLLSQAFDKKKESIMKRIEAWNKSAEEMQKQLDNNEIDSDLIPFFNIAIANYKSRAKRESEYIAGEQYKEDVIKQRRKELGLEYISPKERAQQWYNERAELRQTKFTDDEIEQARQNWLLGKGSYADYLYAAKHPGSTESREEWLNKLGTQRDLMASVLTNIETKTIDDLMRSPFEQQSAREKAEYAVNTRRNAAVNQLLRTSPDDPNFAKLFNHVKDDDYWNQQTNMYENDINKNNAFTYRQQESQLKQIQLQNMQSEAQLRRQYEQQNRGIWGRPHSRIANAYLQQFNMKWAEEQRYIGAIGAAARTGKDLELWRSSFQKDTGMTAAEYREKYAKGGGDTNKLIAASQILKAEEALRHYNVTAEESKEQMEKFSQPAMAMRAGFIGISDSVHMLFQRFGRRMFMKAIQEATQFVKQYDKTMTEIQMITLKSDSEMSKVGDGLVSKAKEMKISIGEISQSAATLYRQGLSDEEVDERLEVISKFSKVSGTKVADATKLVTVAMNTGLVTNAEEAADIVTALGDNAATNAQQIEKGIEKAGAAAAADGTTFGQLAAMLTAITSTTQIGGNVAGRTLNTIMGRMNKIGTGEIIYDENGHAISGSAVSNLLKAQGVETYDANGNKRSTFDVLYDLSKKWDSISDAEQQQIATAIAGTRQYSNFAAIMQGMNEGKIDEYLDLIGQSSGITNQKFEIYTDSLEASLTNLRNTYDNLIKDLTDNGALTGFIDFISTMITGVDNLSKSLGGLGASLVTVIPMIAGVAAIKAGMASGQWWLVGAGAVALGVGAATTALAGNSPESQNKVAQTKYKEATDQHQQQYNEIDNKINRAKTIANKSQAERTEDETKELDSLKKDLSTFAAMNAVANGTTGSLQNLLTAISDLGTSSQNTADAISQLNELNNQQKANDIRNDIDKQAASVLGSFFEAGKEYNKEPHATSSYFSGFIGKDQNTGKYKVLQDFQTYKGSVNSFSQEFYDSNAFARLVQNPDTITTWDKDYAPAYAKLLAEVSKNFGDDVPESFHNKDEKFWLPILKADAFDFHGRIPEKAWDYVLEKLNAESEYDTTGFSYQQEGFKNALAQSFIGQIPSDMIPSIVNGVTENVYSQLLDENGEWKNLTNEEKEAIISREINKVWGIDYKNPASLSYKSMNASAERYAKAYGYGQEEKEKLGKYNLEDGDYYKLENGETVSYDTAVSTRKKGYEVRSKSGDVLTTYAAEENPSTTWYSWTDRRGKKHYYDDESVANKEREEDKDNLWRYTYKYRNSQGDEITDSQTGKKDYLQPYGQLLNSRLKESGLEPYYDLTEELIRAPGEVIKEVVDIIEIEKEEFVEKSKQEIRAIKNHFMAGVESGAVTWKTNNEAKIAADNMLREFQYVMDATEGMEEQDRLQRLYSHINELDIAEWSTLARNNPLFSRILDSIEDDGAGHITHYPEGILKEIGQTIYSMSSSGQNQRSLVAKGQDALKVLDSSKYFNGIQEARDYFNNLGFLGESSLKRDENGYAWFIDRIAAEQAYSTYVKSRKNEENKEIKRLEEESGFYLPPEIVNGKVELDIDAIKRRARGNNELNKTIKEIRDFYKPESEAEFYDKNKIKYLQDSELEALKGLTNEEYIQRLRDGEASSVETAWAYMRARNAANGINGITNDQKLSLSAKLFNAMKTGSLKGLGYTKEINSAAKQDITSGISGLDTLYDAAMMLEDEGLSLSDIYNSEKTEAVTKALKDTYDINSLKTLFKSSSQAAALASYMNTPYYKEMTSLYEGLSSDKVTDQISVSQSTMSSQSKIARAKYALSELDTSKTFEELDDAVVSELASATNYTKDQIKKMWKTDRSGARSELERQINAQQDELYEVYSGMFSSYMAGFEELKNLDGKSFSHDEFINLLEGVEGFDEAWINWARLAGAYMKDGQTEFEQSSENIHKSLTSAQKEEESKSRSNFDRLIMLNDILTSGEASIDKDTAIRNWVEEEAAGSEEFAGTSLGYLASRYGKKGYDVTQEDLLNATRYEILGGGNAFDANSYYIRRLFGSNNINQWKKDEALEAYQSIRETDPELAKQIDNMLTSTGMGTDFFKNQGSWEDLLIAANAQKSLSSDVFSNVSSQTRKEASEKIGTILYGKGYQKDSLFNDAFEKIRKYQNAQNAYTDLSIEANRSMFAESTGMTKKQVDEYVESGKTKELGNILDNQYEALLEDPLMLAIAALGNIDLNSAQDIDALVSELQEAAANAGGKVGELITGFIDVLTNASNAAASSASDFEGAYSEAVEKLSEERNTERGYEALTGVEIREGETALDAFKRHTEGTTGVDWGAFDQANPLFVAALRSNASQEAVDAIITAGRTGQKDIAYQAAIGRSVLGDYVTESGMIRLPTTAAEAKQMQEKLEQINQSTDGRGQLLDEFKDVAGATEVFDEIMRFNPDTGNLDDLTASISKFNDETTSKKSEEIKKYGNAAQRSLDKFTSQDQKIRKLANQMYRYNSIIDKVQSGKVKSGKDLSKEERAALAERTNYSDDELKKMGADMLKKIAEGAKNASTIDWEKDVAIPMIDQINNALNNASEEDVIEWNRIIKATVNMDTGEIDTAKMAEMVASFDADLAAQLMAYAESGATLFAEMFEAGNAVGYKLHFTKSTPGSKGDTGKGGGGGGGKSKADKLIEEQKRKMAVLEHQQKMLETYEKEKDFYNDYSGWRDNLQQQIDLQYDLEAAYKANIRELQELMDKTKQGDDEWYKLRDAIYAAQEALAEIGNTINELNKKRIDITSAELEEKDKPGAHKQSMLEQYASRAMSEDRFKDYERFTEQQIAEKLAERQRTSDSIDIWKGVLGTFEKDTDSWIEARDKIWELEEHNAELDGELVQMQLDLASQRLSQISKVLEQNTQTATHNQSIASTYAGAYESGGYRSQYEAMIREQQKANLELIKENKEAEESVRKQMETLEMGSTAWFEARAALYQYSEAVAQAEVSQLELERTLAQSKIESITEQYTDATRELQHVNELLSDQAQEYLDANDYEAYFEAMRMYMENIPKMIDEEKRALDSLQAEYDRGMELGILDPGTQRQYLDEINERESELQKLVLEQSKKQREIDKARLDQLFEQQEYSSSEFDHNIKLIGYETSKYQNNGELTNVNRMIEVENQVRGDRVKQLKDEIAALEKEHDLFRDGSKEEQRIIEQIKKREEALDAENTQIDKNNKLLEENRKKIMQVRKTLEDAVDKEIEAEKKRQREILSANVNMQNTIVELLKKRLQDEWNLKKKDIQKEKEALSEYKKLINERFNYRKKAADQADKQEEISEYKRQLALIEADLSRTKDAKELRRKIEDLEKEQAWTIAEDEVSAESERVDDQMEGMDKFVQYNEELLQEILGDANNFSTEMNEILTGSFEESYDKILEFMGKENEAFMKSLPDAQKQMIQGWEDTWKKANDIIDNNYMLISTIIQSKDSFLDYMKSTNRDYREYLDAGDENSMKLLEKQWEDYYDNFIASTKDDAEFDLHEHEMSDVVSKIDELKDHVFQVDIIGIDADDVISPYGLDESAIKTLDFSTGEELILEQLEDIYKVIEPILEAPAEESTGSPVITARQKKTYYVYGTKGEYLGEVSAGSEETAQKRAAKKYSDPGSTVYDTKIPDREATEQQESSQASDAIAAGIVGESLFGSSPGIDDAFGGSVTPSNAIKDENKRNIYANGGLVDYTGLAWVDGTKAHPESFLDATDTSILRSMLDSFNFIRKSPYMSHIDSSMFGNSSTVGDINITINQAELKSEDDYDEVAKRVGQAFTKELTKQGLNLSGYAFG